MPFQQRFNEIVQKVPAPISSRHLWLNTLITSVVLFVSVTIYTALRRGFNGLETINSSVAWTSVILISSSFILSSICYFWDLFDTRIIYRKHLGVVGFIYALIHAIISLFFITEFSPFTTYFLSPENFPVFLFGLTALVIFAGMTLISNNYSIHELGGKRWRLLLRIGGYTGLIFAMIHFALRGLPWWLRWLDSGMPFPPPLGFIVFIFTIFVFYFRIILTIDILLKKREVPQQPTQAQSSS